MNVEKYMIVWADLGNGEKHIKAGIRPCLIVSCDIANRYSPVYTIIPGTTSKTKKELPVHFKVSGKDIDGYLPKTTTFLPEQIRTINKEQIICEAGKLSNRKSRKVTNMALIRQ